MKEHIRGATKTSKIQKALKIDLPRCKGSTIKLDALVPIAWGKVGTNSGPWGKTEDGCSSDSAFDSSKCWAFAERPVLIEVVSSLAEADVEPALAASPSDLDESSLRN